MNELDQILVSEHWVGPNELIKAKEDAKKTRKSLFASFVRLGYMKEEDVFAFFAGHSQIPFVRLSDYCIDKEALTLLSEEYCRKNTLIPLFKIDKSLFVAMINPLDAELLIELSNHTGLDVQPLIASSIDIARMLDRFWGPPQSLFDIEQFLFKPQGLKKFPFHRESARLSLSIPVEFTVTDERFRLFSDARVPSTTIDISKSGKALGLTTLVFIPPQVELMLYFDLGKGEMSSANATVVYSRMKRRGEFVMGVRFLSISNETVSTLLGLAKNK